METNVDVDQGHVIVHLQLMEEPIVEERVWRSPTAQVKSLGSHGETFSKSVLQSTAF